MAATKKADKKDKKPKVPCPITRQQFIKDAKPITVVINGQTCVANVKEEFSSGSFGFVLSEKVPIDIGGVPVRFQGTMNLSAINAQEKKKKDDDEE